MRAHARTATLAAAALLATLPAAHAQDILRYNPAPGTVLQYETRMQYTGRLTGLTYETNRGVKVTPEQELQLQHDLAAIGNQLNQHLARQTDAVRQVLQQLTVEEVRPDGKFVEAHTLVLNTPSGSVRTSWRQLVDPQGQVAVHGALGEGPEADLARAAIEEETNTALRQVFGRGLNVGAQFSSTYTLNAAAIGTAFLTSDRAQLKGGPTTVTETATYRGMQGDHAIFEVSTVTGPTRLTVVSAETPGFVIEAGVKASRYDYLRPDGLLGGRSATSIITETLWLPSRYRGIRLVVRFQTERVSRTLPAGQHESTAAP